MLVSYYQQLALICSGEDAVENIASYYYKEMPDNDFSVDIIQKYSHVSEIPVGLHWHEHLQLYYLAEGNASLQCSGCRIDAGPDDLIVINSNEVHSALECRSGDLHYYILRIAPSLLYSNQVDACQAKYISPLSQNLICFKNFIDNDSKIISCVKNIIKEYESKGTGYELEVKASIYHLIVLLLRKYIDRIITQNEFDARIGRMKILAPIFQYIEENHGEKITARILARRANLSLSHFCRIFKQTAGKTSTDYINDNRLEKAAQLLIEGSRNITEIALSCGFYDANYFSRTFKKRFSISPTKFRQEKHFKYSMPYNMRINS